MAELRIVAPYGQQNPAVAGPRLQRIDLQEGTPESYGFEIVSDTTTEEASGVVRLLELDLSARLLAVYNTPELRTKLFENLYKDKVEIQYPGLCSFLYTDR